ncbi:MAG: acyl-CoA synthetase [Betaproteobacteria bacterium]
MSKPAWTVAPERGSMPLLRFMTWLSLTIGRRASRLIVYGIAMYFLLTAPDARRASRVYLRRALEREPGWPDLFRHVMSFASTIHDRLYLLNSRFDLFDITVHGRERLVGALEIGGGAFLMGAHMGSFEVLHALSRQHPGVRAAMVMYEDNASKINAMLAAINPVSQQDIIPLGRIDSMLNVQRQLDAGAFIGVLGDRSFGTDAPVPVSFLGTPAPLPVSAFRMAAVLRRQVIFMAGLYLGGNRYAVHFEDLADFSQTPRNERAAAIEAALTRYAHLLETCCRMAPYNWFNFFDFWAPASGPDSATDAH